MQSIHVACRRLTGTATRTGGLIGCEDALPWGYYPQSDVLQLLLLLGTECWVLVSHGGYNRDRDRVRAMERLHCFIVW